MSKNNGHISDSIFTGIVAGAYVSAANFGIDWFEECFRIYVCPTYKVLFNVLILAFALCYIYVKRHRKI